MYVYAVKTKIENRMLKEYSKYSAKIYIYIQTHTQNIHAYV